MRLLNFQINNYCSIIDTGIINLSLSDNVLVFAGQNESGKSAILKALYDFECGEFEVDSLPFYIDTKLNPSVSCTYKIEKHDNLFELITKIVKDKFNLQISDEEYYLDETKINKLAEFTITRTIDGNNIQETVDDITFTIFRSAILNKTTQAAKVNEIEKETKTEEKYFLITDEDNEKVAEILFEITPNIIFFDDFCDLLPDKILISDLSESKKDTKGYHAVRNLEKILNTNFVLKNSQTDPVRRTIEYQDSEILSIDFQKDWGQRIHEENKVTIKYDFEKRNESGEKGSYINFQIETKEGQPLQPKQRSKGLIWFLSLWLELKAQDIEHNDLILLLDEPDQHLHVKAQKDILKLINTLANNKGKRKGKQIIYATHSPYLIEVEHLNRTKLIINTEDQGTKVEDITTCKIDTKYKRDALQPIADAMGLNVSAFSTLGKKNAILEGISDFYYFSGMKKLLDRSGDYHFVPGIGVRQINNLISLSIGYGLDWIAIIDDDPARGGKDSKKKFNEIRDFVFDGNEEETKKKVHILENIIGIENMFAHEDLLLIDSGVVKNGDNDRTKEVGKKRKVLFSMLFFEKVNNDEITKDNLSKTSKNNFMKAFDFIDNVFLE